MCDIGRDMFTRVMKQKNKDGTVRNYLCLIKSYRENGKVKQRMIANLGRLEEEMTPDKVDVLIGHLVKHADQTSLINILKDLKSKASKQYGELEIFRKVFKQTGVEGLLRKKLADTEKQVDYVEAIFMAICNRLMNPMSKQALSEWKERVYAPKWEPLKLEHVYRGMDFLVERKEQIETELFEKTKTLFNCKVNVMMFDTTTISYWGKGEAEIFQYSGRPKDKRKDLKQLVVGIIMDQDGTPLGHEVWPGNMSDKPAFVEVIKRIKTKFGIEKVILVCDRGMISEANISYLEEQNYEYILGVKMRSLNDIRQRLLLNEEGFKDLYYGGRKGKEKREWELWRDEQIEKREIKKAKGVTPRPLDPNTLETLKETPKGQRRWVVCLNEQIAKEDAEKRAYFQQIMEQKVEHNTAKEWIIKNGYKKYVTITDFNIEIDYGKLSQDELYDGKWVLITNTKMPILNLIKSYKHLYRNEHLFRTLKSELDVGPIRHWTEKRVRAHIFICFLALQIRAYITKKLKELDPDLSYTKVMQDVADIRANIYDIKDKRYIQRTEFNGQAHLAFRATGTKIPPEFLDTQSIEIPLKV